MSEVWKMCAVNVHVDALHAAGVGVAGNVIPPVDYQTFFATGRGFVGKYRAEQARADDQIIIFHE